MRYLKTFESANHTFYTIPHDEGFLSIIGGYEDKTRKKEFIRDNWDNFTQSEINQVEKIFPNNCIALNRLHSLHEVGHLLDPTHSKYPFVDIFIYKLRDEWYYVKASGISGTYKCDQWDGLIDCLNHIKKQYIKNKNTKYKIVDYAGEQVARIKRFNEDNSDIDKKTPQQIKRYISDNFVATRSNIEKLVDDTKDFTQREMMSVSYSLGVTAGGLYCLIMKDKYNIRVPI